MRYALDANVLIYTLDPRDPVKRETAKAVLRSLTASGLGAMPAQALGEFSVNALRKLNLAPQDVAAQVQGYARTFPVLNLTSGIVLEALRGVRDFRLSYFDAQIWAAARLAQVPYVLSEDFNPGATLEGVTFINPFDPGFDPAGLV